MEITSILIQPHLESEGNVRATAEVILNGSLTLRGIKILRGRYGLFLAYPGVSANTPYRAFETLSMRFRMELQVKVLKAYHQLMNSPIPLFG